MNYKSKRVRKKISIYTMAKELGISKEKYKEVEEGYRTLEGNLMDKFYEVLDNAKNINFNRIQKLNDINNWIESGQIITNMNKMGYNEQTLASKLKVTKQSIHNIINKKKVSDDLKEEVYDFLNNNMNKIIKKETNTKRNFKMVSNIGGIDMKNNLNKLNNMLFEELEKLNNVSSEELNIELNRANSMSKIASQIINNAHLGLKAVELANSIEINKKEMPQALIYSDDNE